jgi:hypothetical protein
MERNIFSGTNTLKSGWVSFLCMAAMALVIFANPKPAQSTDRLMVQDSSGNIKFSARDDGTMMLNSNAWPANAPTWALIYGSSNTNSNSGLAMDSYGSSATLGGGFEFRFARGTQASPTADENGDRLGFFVFYGYDGTNFLGSAGLTAKVDGPVSTGIVPEKLTFETLSTGYPRLERMVITSAGNIGIGGDTGSGIPEPTKLLYLAGGAYSDGTNWYNASSREYKENIETLTREEADQVLDGLSPVKYNYKTDKENRHVGFVAEDVPDLVATKERKALSPMDIVAVLTKVVQEQKSAMAEQTNRLSEQKNRIAEQTNMISELARRLDAMQQEINRVKGMNMVGSIDANIK